MSVLVHIYIPYLEWALPQNALSLLPPFLYLDFVITNYTAEASPQLRDCSTKVILSWSTLGYPNPFKPIQDHGHDEILAA